MAISAKNIIMIAISLIIISIILPIALTYTAVIPVQEVVVNNVTYTVGDQVDSSLITMLTILIPLMALIGILLAYVQYTRSD